MNNSPACAFAAAKNRVSFPGGYLLLCGAESCFYRTPTSQKDAAQAQPIGMARVMTHVLLLK